MENMILYNSETVNIEKSGIAFSTKLTLEYKKQHYTVYSGRQNYWVYSICISQTITNEKI
jgi:hypothetical protein